MEKLRYKPEIIDVDALYYKLFNKYNDPKKSRNQRIMADIISTHTEALTKIKNNLNNPLDVKKREDYVFVTLLEHSSYPRRYYRDGLSKMPKGVMMVDIQDAGGWGLRNTRIDRKFLELDYYHLLSGDTSKLSNKKVSLKLIKYIEKNIKVYNEGDYYPNLTISFDEKSEFINPKNIRPNWGVVISKYNGRKYDNYYVNNKYYGDNEEAVHKLAEYSHKKMERNAVTNTSDYIREIKKISPDKTIVFIPISCRGFRIEDNLNRDLYLYKPYLDYATIFDQIYSIARKKIRDNMEKYLKYQTPDSIVDYYYEYDSRAPDPKRAVKRKPGKYSGYFVPKEHERKHFSVVKQNLYRRYVTFYDKVSTDYLSVFSKDLYDVYLRRLESVLREGTKNYEFKDKGTLKDLPRVEMSPGVKCSRGQIWNPKNYRCVSKSSDIGKKLVEEKLKRAKDRLLARHRLKEMLKEREMLSKGLKKKTVKAQKGKKAKSPVPKNKTMKACPSDKVLNPKTGRCVSKTGALGKNILAEQAKKTKKAKTPVPKVPKKKTMKAKSPVKKQEAQKVCPSDKVLNPKTGRCVNKTGVTGKKILAEQAKKTKKVKTPSPKPSPKKYTIKKSKKKIVLKEKSKSKSQNKTKKVCPPTKVLNPKTGRCVNKDGAVAKRLGLA